MIRPTEAVVLWAASILLAVLGMALPERSRIQTTVLWLAAVMAIVATVVLIIEETPHAH